MQPKSTAIAAYKEFPGRSHFISAGGLGGGRRLALDWAVRPISFD